MNTQCDLFLPGGMMPVINRGRVLPNIRKLMTWARRASEMVISSLECRRVEGGARGLPVYCIDRSAGQRKVPITLLPTRVVVHNNNNVNVPAGTFEGIQQIILMKRSRDFLSNPKMDRLLHDFPVNHVVVFGAVAERCVKSVVLSLLARGHRVGVISDACGAWSAAEAELALRKMQAKGAVLVGTDEMVSGAADEELRRRQPAFEPAPPDDAAARMIRDLQILRGSRNRRADSSAPDDAFGNRAIPPAMERPFHDAR